MIEEQYAPKRTVRRYETPPDGYCLCGCGGRPKMGGFLVGHWNKTPAGRALASRVLTRNRPRGRESSSYKGTVAERLEAKLGEPDERGCRRFRGRHINGYGVLTDLDRKARLAHRVAYIAAYGVDALGDGLVLHHECGVRDCCSVEHLVPMTNSEHATLHNRLRHEAESGLPRIQRAPSVDAAAA